MNWFLYDRDLLHKRVNTVVRTEQTIIIALQTFRFYFCRKENLTKKLSITK